MNICRIEKRWSALYHGSLYRLYFATHHIIKVKRTNLDMDILDMGAANDSALSTRQEVTYLPSSTHTAYPDT